MKHAVFGQFRPRHQPSLFLPVGPAQQNLPPCSFNLLTDCCKDAREQESPASDDFSSQEVMGDPEIETAGQQLKQPFCSIRGHFIGFRLFWLREILLLVGRPFFHATFSNRSCMIVPALPR